MPPSYGLYMSMYRKITLDYVPLKTIQFLSEHFLYVADSLPASHICRHPVLYLCTALVKYNSLVRYCIHVMFILCFFFNFFYLAVYSVRSYLYFRFCYYYCTLVSFYILDFILYRTVDVYISMGNLNV